MHRAGFLVEKSILFAKFATLAAHEAEVEPVAIIAPGHKDKSIGGYLVLNLNRDHNQVNQTPSDRSEIPYWPLTKVGPR